MIRSEKPRTATPPACLPHQVRRRLLPLTAWVALALLASAASPASAVEQRTFDQTFEAPADGETLRLANLAGTVRFRNGSGDAVQVRAVVHAEGRNRAETDRLLQSLDWVDATDSKGRRELALSYPIDDFDGFCYPEGGKRRRHDGLIARLLRRFDSSRTTTSYLGRRVAVTGSCSASRPLLYADLEVTVPQDGALALRNAVGRITGGELSGDLAAGTGSGNIELAGFEGVLALSTGSGTVELGRVRGETAVSTGSGSVDVRELIGNGVLTTGSGSVRVHRVAAGKLKMRTGSGRIEVRDGNAGELIADTGSGSIRVLSVEVQRFDAGTGSGSVRLESSLAGAEEIEIDTASGSVSIVAGPEASFELSARQGSGSLSVGYDDATLVRRGHKVVGAERRDGRTRIRIGTGSGGVSINPSY